MLAIIKNKLKLIDLKNGTTPHFQDCITIIDDLKCQQRIVFLQAMLCLLVCTAEVTRTLCSQSYLLYPALKI